MPKLVDKYTHLNIEAQERNNMRKYHRNITPGHFVRCFYVRTLRINVIALNLRQVTRHYNVDARDVSKTVCMVSMLNDDLLNTGIKEFAYSSEKIYNEVKELNYETT